MNDDNLTFAGAKVKSFAIKTRLLITLEEAGEMLSIAPRTVRRLSQMGKLPPLVKLGHSIRISYPDLLDYLQGGSWKGAKA